MNAFDPLVTLKLSIQRAMLADVRERLVSLTCGLNGRHIQSGQTFFVLVLIFSGPPTRTEILSVFRTGGRTPFEQMRTPAGNVGPACHPSYRLPDKSGVWLKRIFDSVELRTHLRCKFIEAPRL